MISKLSRLNLIIFIVISTFIYSCKEKPLNSFKKEQDKLNLILSLAGENRSELQKVLDFYKKDSLKLAAAIFLISNMDLYCSNTPLSKSLKRLNDLRFNKLDSINKLNTFIDIDVIDSLIDVSSVEKNLLCDYNIVTADYLIENIEYAFLAWENAKWAKSINFDRFCEYILPYRLHSGPLERWRPYFYNKYQHVALDTSNCLSAVVSINNEIIKWLKWKNEINPNVVYSSNNILKSKSGTCTHEEIIKLYAMRSIGVPISLDFYNFHGLNSIVLSDSINFSFSSFNNPIKNDFPFGYFSTVVPKVYRYTFSEQKESLASCEVDLDKIPPYFRDKNILDVTKFYPPHSNIIVNIDTTKFSLNNKYLYLAFFDTKRWVIAAWAKRIKDFSEFNYLRRGIVYLPCLYVGENDKITPIGNPFILNFDGLKEDISADMLKTDPTIKLYRKFHLTSRVESFATGMVGGKFQVSKSDSFSNKITLFSYTITSKPKQGWNTIYINLNESFRYVNYQAPSFSFGNISEVRITDENDVNLIDNNYNIKELATLLDTNKLTYFHLENPLNEFLPTIKLIKEVKKIKISYIPRNDVNTIEPDNIYELFYWNNSWVSLGRQQTDSSFLIYKNVPSKSLLWLSNLTSGNEERIFIYKNKKQVFW
ncbi:MAG: hypothetical protein SFY32_16460 [Bacteroidota bacterium]|nr:hypothetical protein [Bacteroidota bacterium]